MQKEKRFYKLGWWVMSKKKNFTKGKCQFLLQFQNPLKKLEEKGSIFLTSVRPSEKRCQALDGRMK